MGTTFQPMLAFNKEPILTFPLYASVKLDGLRMVRQSQQVLSRTLKLIPNNYVRARFGDVRLEGFDGELIMGPPSAEDVFSKTTSACMSVDGEPDVQFYVFDDFTHPDASFETRMNRLHNRHQQHQHPNVWLVNQVRINNEIELATMETQALEQGFEGLMLRIPGGIYKYGRSTGKEGILQKLKRFAHMEASIISVEEQMENTNTAYKNEVGRTKRSTDQAGMVGKDTAGALVVCGLNGPFKGVTFNMPVGTAANAADLWDKRHNVAGLIVRVKYFPIGSKDAPRFPTWAGFRDKIDIGDEP